MALLLTIDFASVNRHYYTTFLARDSASAFMAKKVISAPSSLNRAQADFAWFLVDPIPIVELSYVLQQSLHESRCKMVTVSISLVAS